MDSPHDLAMVTEQELVFTSLLISRAAHMCTFPIATLFTRSWIATAAGILGVYCICLAGCILPSKTEHAIRRMRRFFLASPLSFQCSTQLQATVVLLQSYTCTDMCRLCISGAACYWLFCCCQLHCVRDLHHWCGKYILCSG